VLQNVPLAQRLKILFQLVFKDENLIHASVVDPPLKSILGENLPTCALAPLGRLILPSLTAASAGVARGLTKEATGTRSEPTSAATTICVIFERIVGRNCLAPKENTLSTGPLVIKNGITIQSWKSMP
jgi:hypothetical protein